LKEDKKNVWFGNVGIGLGTNDRYKGSGNIGLLKKEVKLFNLNNLNNIGELAVSQIKNNSTIFSGYETNKKIEKQSNELVNIDNLSSSNFSKNEDIFNDSFLNSLSFVTNLSKETKLRSLSYYALDKIDKQNSTINEYFTTPETVRFEEQRDLDLKNIFFGTELEIKHISKSGIYFEYDFSIEGNPTHKKGEVLSNENQITQTQDDKKHNLFNYLGLTKKLT